MTGVRGLGSRRAVSTRARCCAASLLIGVLLAGCAGSVTSPSDAERALPGSLRVPDDAQDAVVVRVTDGDTVVLRGRGTGPLPSRATRVRVLLVDTPEVHPRTECLGEQASRRTAQLVPPGSQVRVQADQDPEDRYGRALLHVWNADGAHLGEVLLAEGYARILQVEPNRRHLRALEAREAAAREAGRGLWSACSSGARS